MVRRRGGARALYDAPDAADLLRLLRTLATRVLNDAADNHHIPATATEALILANRLNPEPPKPTPAPQGTRKGV